MVGDLAEVAGVDGVVGKIGGDSTAIEWSRNELKSHFYCKMEELDCVQVKLVGFLFLLNRMAA